MNAKAGMIPAAKLPGKSVPVTLSKTACRGKVNNRRTPICKQKTPNVMIAAKRERTDTCDASSVDKLCVPIWHRTTISRNRPLLCNALTANDQTISHTNTGEAVKETNEPKNQRRPGAVSGERKDISGHAAAKSHDSTRRASCNTASRKIAQQIMRRKCFILYGS